MSDPSVLFSGQLAGLFAAELIDLAPDGLAVIGEDGTILFANRQLNRLFGYDGDQLVGEAVELLVPESLRPAHYTHRAGFRADPRVRSMGAAGRVFSGQRKDGSQFPVEVSLSPMQVGWRTVVVAAVRDVTERLALDADGRAVLKVLDAAGDAMLVFDRETLRFTYVNEGAVRQLGYSRDELLTMTQLDVKTALTETAYRGMIDGLPSGASTTFSTVHRRKNGTLVDVEVTLQHPNVDPSAEGSRWLISVARDVSQRTSAERRLRDAERELAVLDDRQRIARDLHDRVIQRIFTTGLAASALSRQVTDPDVADRIGQLVAELDGVIAELRSSIFRLAHAEAPNPLPHRVLELCDAECEQLGIAANVRFVGPVDDMDATRAEELLAVLREALANVVRHANASAVEVAVLVDGSITLRVEDDGIGLPAPGAALADDGVRSGFGLRNMAARARHLGGSLRVGRATPSGTRVEWRVPAGGEPLVPGPNLGLGTNDGLWPRSA